MKRTIIQESDNGLLLCYDKLPSNILRFSIVKERTFKDNTCKYKISAYMPGLNNKMITIKRIRGKKSDAIKALETFLREQ